MAKNFFERLRTYYLEVAAVLRGEAGAASIFPNAADIGASRERVYAEFLRQHAPSKCNVLFGGFLFGEDGSESGQVDVIVTTDTTPQFNLHNRDGQGKAFSPVEGTLAIASIKSTLNRNELFDALIGLAKIPHTKPLTGRVNLSLPINNYEDWPYKIIYATDGVSLETLMGHLTEFYEGHPEIPVFRRPNVIHVSGKYVVFRATPGMSEWNAGQQMNIPLEEGKFRSYVSHPDLQGILWVLDQLQVRATASAHILYSYSDLINRVNGVA